MKIELLLFASSKELFGQSRISIDLPDGAKVADLKAALVDREPNSATMIQRCAFSVDEFTKQPIDSNAVLASVSTPDAGANVLFLGTTRQFTRGQETVQLDYEGYETMVLKELTAIRDSAMERWPIQKCSIVHRFGTVALADSAPTGIPSGWKGIQLLEHSLSTS